ncbi:hypothetical protein A2160_05570 [Candidatus Beckwithbacteria bacterium RBG_13_42_9]|uniref:Uncharacterized protein n=1 Tax=Candidatus Beckwithbacteria bacterium RBG_13_42_9 TaxID=1797457 RepID=A0A1F5E629_9BACT|nr:MAG: hypothetical protein A2160_05570 [Candidatus Beckwithbacteria bacterium RBG_13_42_9]
MSRNLMDATCPNGDKVVLVIGDMPICPTCGAEMVSTEPLMPYGIKVTAEKQGRQASAILEQQVEVIKIEGVMRAGG